MLNKLNDEILEEMTELENNDTEIFQLEDKVKLLERGGFDELMFIRLVISYISIIIDILFLTMPHKYINLPIGLFIIFTNSILLSSGKILNKTIYLIKHIKNREEEQELDNAAFTILKGKVIRKEQNDIEIKTGTKSYVLTMHELCESRNIILNEESIFLCCVYNDEFEIIGCKSFQGYKERNWRISIRRKFKESKAYQSTIGIFTLTIIALILSIIIRILNSYFK